MAQYHASNNLVATIAGQMHTFVIPAGGATVDITLGNPQNLPGLVQILNSSGVVVAGNNPFTRTFLPAGTYHWNIIGGPASAVLGATGHTVVVQDRIN
jgi:hypothetical protein